MKICNLKTSTAGLTFVSLCCMSLLGCSDTTLGSRSFEETVGPETIPGAFVQIPLAISDFVFPINLTEQPGYDEDDLDFVTSIRIRNIVFEIAPDSDDPGVDLFPDGNPDTFDFVSSLSISLSATIDGVNTVVPIANLPISDPQIASNTQTLNLNVEDRDIRDFIEAPGGSELLVSFEGLTPVDFVRISANIRYRVGIGIR